MQNVQYLSVLVHEQAKRYGDKTVMTYRDYEKNEWLPISWNEFSDTVKKVSDALLALGVKVQENIATFSQNKPECLFVAFGAYGIRSVTVPFYATSSEAQISYMINDADIRYVFVGEQYQYDTAFRVLSLCPSMQKLIIFDRSVKKNQQDNVSIYFDEFLTLGEGTSYEAEKEARMEKFDPDELADILYTSGTTGVSKGVMLTHRMYYDALIANDAVLSLSEKDVALDFLPFTHVFERAWSYLVLTEGAQLAVNLRPTEVTQSLREVRPSCMCVVPRFWEKVYSGVQEKINSSSPIQRKLMLEAIKVGKEHNVDYKMRGLIPPLGQRLRY
ncbi:MAG: AMP-binding protein, partial [Paraprevotella sp.]|nr:AMP-binding protein [Paraprevotella sp.]